MKSINFIALLVLIGSHGTAQPSVDTLRLSLQAAENIFLQNNLALLANRYNIDAGKALVKQARLWDNPVITTDQNLYDKQGGFLKHDQYNGQIYVQVMQLIKTAGKRNKAVQLAADNTKLSEEQFNDLLRSLRYALRTDLLEISHLLKIKRVYDGEIAEVNKLITGMDLQLQVGNISVRDNLRIKALLFSLQNELVNVEVQLMPLENELKILLNNKPTGFIAPVLEYQFSQLTTLALPTADELLKQGLATRPDIQMAQTMMDYQNHNVAYQKALAKPDISIGTEFDQHSSYSPNYVGLVISFPLNILNHNQGNISAAKFAVQQQKLLVDQAGLRIQQDIVAAVEKIRFYQGVNNLQQLDFSKKYDTLFFNMLKSYLDRQINLLDFIDFMDAYKDTKLKLVEQHHGLVRSIEDLNYAVGADMVKLN